MPGFQMGAGSSDGVPRVQRGNGRTLLLSSTRIRDERARDRLIVETPTRIVSIGPPRLNHPGFQVVRKFQRLARLLVNRQPEVLAAQANEGMAEVDNRARPSIEDTHACCIRLTHAGESKSGPMTSFRTWCSRVATGDLIQ